MPWPQDDKPTAPQLTPGMALWNYIKNSVPSQLGQAGQMASGIAAPFAHLFGNGGQEFWNGPQDPQAAQDMRNALMTMYSGSAAPSAAEVAAPAAASAFSKMYPGMGKTETLFSGPLALRGYRGSTVHETWPPPGSPGYPNLPLNDTFWATSDPELANRYAGVTPSYIEHPEVEAFARRNPNVTPADFNFQNPLVVDAQGRRWDNIPDQEALDHLPLHSDVTQYGITTDMLRQFAAEAGHDGLVVRNVRDEGPSATTIAALQPGTVKSPLTGETLFSGSDKAPNPVVAALMAALRAPAAAASNIGDRVTAKALDWKYPNEISAARSIVPATPATQRILSENASGWPYRAEVGNGPSAPTMTAANQNALPGTYKAGQEAQGLKPFGVSEGDLYSKGNPLLAAIMGLIGQQPQGQR